MTLTNPDEKVRKPIYVPNNSPVEEWANQQKSIKKGLLSAQVRHILKNSLEVTMDPSSERVENYVDCLMMVQDAKQTIFESPTLPVRAKETVPESIGVATAPTAVRTQDNAAMIRAFNANGTEKSNKGNSIELLHKLAPMDLDEDD